MYKNLTSTITDLDAKGRVVVAANAFGNVDVQKDMSLKGSFSKTIKENFNRVKWFLNHDTTQLIGVPIEATETDKYLQITGQLNLNKEIGRNIYEDYKLYAEHNKSLEHSIGVDYQDGYMEKGIRKVTQWKLWEYSTLTNWGANPDTPMLGLKWAELQMKEGNYTDERFKQIEAEIQRFKQLLERPAEAIVKTQLDYSDLKGISTIFLKSLN